MRVATDLGFVHQGSGAPFQIFPGYTIPFLGSAPLSTVLAGASGALVVAGVAMVLVRLLRKSASPA